MAELVTRLSVDDRQFKQNLESAAAAVESATARMNRAAASIDLIGQRFEAIESGTKKVTRALSDATGALNLLGEQGRVAAAALTPLANALNTISDANGALGTFFRGSSAARNMFSRLSSLIPAIGAVVTAGTALYGTYRAVVPATEAATDAEKKYQEMLRATEPYVRSTAEAVRDLEAAKRADARATTEGTIAALKADIAEYERDLEYLRELEQSAESQANAPVRRGALRGGAARQALENLPDTIREIEGKLSSLNRRLSESYARLESVDRPAEQAAQSLRSAARATGALEEALARLRIGRADTIDELKQQVSEVKQIWQATLTPFERYVQGIERLGELRETIEGLYGAEGADVIIDRQARALQSALESAEARTERASDAARQLGMTFESAFERAIAGGEKLSVVLTALANDIARIIIRQTITQPLAGAITSFISPITEGIGNFFTGLFKAEGGPVRAGQPYIVGERGPELFVPGASGAIVPNGGWQTAEQSGGVTIVQNIDARGADATSAAQLRAAAQMIVRESVAATLDAIRRGGAARAIVRGA